MVLLRNRHKGAREHKMQCKAGTTRVRLPVQRLVIVLPGREQPEWVIEELLRQEAPDDLGVRAAAGRGGLQVQVPVEEEEVLDLCK